MFDDAFELARCCPASLGDLVADNHAWEKRHGCRKLLLAVAWADLFSDPDDVSERDADGAWLVGDSPGADSPGADSPGADSPGADSPGADSPGADSPGADSPGADSPGADSPLGAVRGRRKAGPRTEGFIRPGGNGTPWIAETCPAELGLWQQQSPGSARCLIGDALDLRHRLPRLWGRVVAGEVHAWKARTVAVRSRYLGLFAVAELDRLITHQVELVTWGRFESILDAALLHVDPAAYHERVQESHSRRGVWPGESSAGLRSIIIRAAQGDAAVFWAAVNRVADLLADEGDEDPVNVRRSKAVGILANPTLVLDLVNRHIGQPDPDEDPCAYLPDPSYTNPWEQEPRPGWDTTPYHQPDPKDPAYQTSQKPPDQPEPPEPPEPLSRRMSSSDPINPSRPLR